MKRGPNDAARSGLDYAFMIGGPIAFLLFALLGIYWVLGPGPPPNPVKLIRDGAVTAGMTRKQVLDKVGLPKSESTNPDGSITWRYSHGAEEAFVEDDAYVDFGSGGRVINVTVERTHVRPPDSAASTTK